MAWPTFCVAIVHICRLVCFIYCGLRFYAQSHSDNGHVHATAPWSAHELVNLPQDVVSLANNLPQLPSELDVIVVRKEDSNQSHRDFRILTTVVEQALQWLISNSIYYDANHIHINQETLACLLQDGCLKIVLQLDVETDPAPSDEELYDSHGLSKIIHTPKLYTHPRYSLLTSYVLAQAHPTMIYIR